MIVSLPDGPKERLRTTWTYVRVSRPATTARLLFGNRTPFPGFPATGATRTNIYLGFRSLFFESRRT